jgi:hypothetical protein
VRDALDPVVERVHRRDPGLHDFADGPAQFDNAGRAQIVEPGVGPLGFDDRVEIAAIGNVDGKGPKPGTSMAMSVAAT